jgi:hypothetical protein
MDLQNLLMKTNMQKFLLPFFLSLVLIGSPILVSTSLVATVEGQLLPCSPTTPDTSPCRNPDGTTRPATSPGGGQQDPPGGGQEDPPGGGDPITEKIVNPLRVNNIPELLAIILSAIIQIAIPFLVLAMMWVGFLFVAARGNASKLAEARQALYFTLLGALIILGAQTLATILSGTIAELTDIPTN